MNRIIDLIDKKFGKLTVIKLAGTNKQYGALWLCKCECGNEIIVLATRLKNGNTKSCGCLYGGCQNNLKHGHTQSNKTSRIYNIWKNMIQRCTNPKFKQYKDYGGRGIKVCKRWLEFENFFNDVGIPPTNKYEINRKNNDGNYCKINYEWTTHTNNNRNRRNNHLETVFGRTQCRSAWAEEYNMPLTTFISRIDKLGWPIEKALTFPVKNNRRRLN